VYGGAGYIDNDGKAIMNNNTRIIRNTGIRSSFLFLINTKAWSVLDNVYMEANDEANSFIVKNVFL
jgi:hypothetical protein